MPDRSLLNQDIVLIDWDHTSEQLPTFVEGTIVEERDSDAYVVSLTEPVEVSGTIEKRLVITRRHAGYPVTRSYFKSREGNC